MLEFLAPLKIKVNLLVQHYAKCHILRLAIDSIFNFLSNGK